MSGIPYNVTISSDSPTVNYLPLRDGAISEGWNMSCTDSIDSEWIPQTFCVGPSSHRSTFVGASLFLDFQGTGAFLYGSATAGSYVVEVDGQSRSDFISDPSSGLLGKVEGLNNDLHRIYLNVTQSNLVSFYEAVLTILIDQQDSASVVRNQTILPFTTSSDGNAVLNPSFTYTGTWFSDLPGTIGTTGNAIYPRQHTSQTGAYVTFELTQASAFFVYGLVNVDLGPFSVTLSPSSDVGQPITNFYNSNAHWINLDRVMYWTSGLNRDKTYSIKITNMGQDDTPWWDFSHIDIIGATSNALQGPSQSSKHHKASVGVIAGAAAGAVALIALLILLWICYQRKRRSQAPSSNLMGDISQEVKTPILSPPLVSTVTQQWLSDNNPILVGHAEPLAGNSSNMYNSHQQSAVYIAQSSEATMPPSVISTSTPHLPGESRTSYTKPGQVAMSWNGEERTQQIVREEDAGSISGVGERVIRLPPNYKDSWSRDPRQ